MIQQYQLHASLVVLLLFAGLSAPSFAEVHYRWIDERGQPVHSDRPPPAGVDYEVISPGSGLKRPVEGQQGAVPADLSPTVSNEFEPVPQIEQAPKKNPEYCQRARDNLMALRSARVRLRNDQGEYYYLDEEQKEAERIEARAAIEAYCEE